MADRHANFAYSTVTGTTANNGSNPGTTGITITIGNGQGFLMPDTPFNATVWPTGAQPLANNAEIVRVVDRNGDTLTLLDTNGDGSGVRAPQEGTTSRSIIVGDQIAATVTAKTLTDAAGALSTYSPYVLASGAASALQTLGSNFTNIVGTNSLFVFPFTLPQSIQFNQIILANQLSLATATVAAASHTYYSLFGLYSMNANTLSLITNNSFVISEVINSRSVVWTYPTATATSGYGYGQFPLINTATSQNSSLTTTGQMVSYISGSRAVGLQFNANLTLSGGVYWLGLLSLRSNGDTRSTHGLSNQGIIGHIVQGYNQPGNVSGPLPIGYAASNWTSQNIHVTQWWGRQIMGFATATTVANYRGSTIPVNITLSQLSGAYTNSTNISWGTVLPSITFVST